MHRVLALLPRAGRLLYGLTMLAFGLEQLVLGALPKGLWPQSLGFSLTAYALGGLFSAIGSSLLAGRAVRLAAGVAASLFGATFLLFHLSRLGFTTAQTTAWTPAFEVLALGAGGLVLASAAAPLATTLGGRAASQLGFRVGQLLFASALGVFGVLHFLFAQFVATLVPAWIPGHLFWAYFVGVAFLTTSLSLVLGRWVGLASGLLGLMFSLWLLLLHGPRVASKPAEEAEWTSLFVAMAMSGAAYSMATRSTKARASQALSSHVSVEDEQLL